MKSVQYTDRSKYKRITLVLLILLLVEISIIVIFENTIYSEFIFFVGLINFLLLVASFGMWMIIGNTDQFVGIVGSDYSAFMFDPVEDEELGDEVLYPTNNVENPEREA